MKYLIKTNALVLKKRNFGEYDRIILLLTEKYGRVDVLVRGARKPGSRIGGLCESYLMLNVEINQRKGLDILTDAELKYDFKMLEKNLIGLGVGGLLIEVVEMLGNYGQDDQSIYSLLKEYLLCYERNRFVIDQKYKVELFVASFLMSVLAESGRLPVLDGCIECGSENEEKYFLLENGLCCAKCLKNSSYCGWVDKNTAGLCKLVSMMSADKLVNSVYDGDTSGLLSYCLWLFDLYHKKNFRSFDFLNKVYKNL